VDDLFFGWTCANKACPYYGVKGHNEAQCFKNKPYKAPAWWKEKHEKTESATLSSDVTLTSLGNIM
jgi:hypothetical protein